MVKNQNESNMKKKQKQEKRTTKFPFSKIKTIACAFISKLIEIVSELNNQTSVVSIHNPIQVC